MEAGLLHLGHCSQQGEAEFLRLLLPSHRPARPSDQSFLQQNSRTEPALRSTTVLYQMFELPPFSCHCLNSHWPSPPPIPTQCCFLPKPSTAPSGVQSPAYFEMSVHLFTLPLTRPTTSSTVPSVMFFLARPPGTSPPLLNPPPPS